MTQQGVVEGGTKAFSSVRLPRSNCTDKNKEDVLHVI